MGEYTVMRKSTKKYIISIWILLLVSFATFLIMRPGLIDPKEFVLFIEGFWVWAFLVYAIVFLIRGILLVPSTPLIIAGILLFPGNPHIVFIISMIGVIFSSFIIYQFSDVLGLNEQYDKHVQNIKMRKIIEKYGFFAVALWSFFLILPTDLVCYIAGAVRMKLYKFLAAIMLGEGLIIGIFVYSGKDIVTFIADIFGA
jgi:uncharacterized membrane protein YdjX (TVP38/TMEM64 family)